MKMHNTWKIFEGKVKEKLLNQDHTCVVSFLALG